MNPRAARSRAPAYSLSLVLLIRTREDDARVVRCRSYSAVDYCAMSSVPEWLTYLHEAQNQTLHGRSTGALFGDSRRERSSNGLEEQLEDY